MRTDIVTDISGREVNIPVLDMHVMSATTVRYRERDTQYSPFFGTLMFC
jgi:hypothetical protein